MGFARPGGKSDIYISYIHLLDFVIFYYDYFYLRLLLLLYFYTTLTFTLLAAKAVMSIQNLDRRRGVQASSKVTVYCRSFSS